VTADEIAQTRSHIRELKNVSEREIHEVVLSCTRAGRQLLNSTPTSSLSWRHQLAEEFGALICRRLADRQVDQVDVVDVSLVNG
jgi:hypothetical protein